MPKEITYTNDSLEKAIELAEAVYLIAPCSADAVAEKLNKSAKGGSFRSLIASTKKFDLIEVQNQKYISSDLYKSLRNPYDEIEKMKLLRQSFLFVPLYNELYDRFKGKPYPNDSINTILIREYSISEADANRIAGYFKQGSILCGLLDSTNNEFIVGEDEVQEEAIKSDHVSRLKTIDSKKSYIISLEGPQGKIIGPIEITDLDELEYVSGVINSAFQLIEKKLKEKSNDENL